ncbi:sulfatase [Flammeovirga sp. MY04]|uniref:sulfatase n=1 Tax=Flammeovirga sp. MY04 TaxID=1191459 RepID=UPI0008060FAD|nr:sulfatase [Flammeovirga sp. MY04]ANQ52592.1 sulfatase [Flammeovirga sp. MY04]
MKKIFILFGLLLGHQVFAQNDKPNIVFIYIDDMGWADLGCYGNTYHESPAIDAFAKQGIRYTNAYAPAPVCSPARAGVFSGMYPAKLGITDWMPGHWRPYEKKLAVINRTQYLPLEIETFGEALKDAGYKTGYFGKWHLGDDEEHFVDKQGFDDIVMYQGGGRHYKLSDKFYPKQEIDDEVYLTDALTDYSCDFLERNKDEQFLLVISHFAVHIPLQAPDSLVQHFEEKSKTMPVNNPLYGGMIKSLDNNIKVVLDKLDELGLSENTFVVLYSDNGGLYQPYDLKYLEFCGNIPVTSNAPLRGEKGNLYEGGVRVPMMARWPGKISPNTVSNTSVSGIDLFPTFLELAGVKKGNRPLDGQSLVATFSGKDVNHDRPLYWHYPVFHHGDPASSVRMGDYKLIKNYVTEEVELYNLSDDIGEQNNLSDTHKKMKKKMLKSLEAHLDKVKADLPTDNPNFDQEKRLEWGVHPDKHEKKANK